MTNLYQEHLELGEGVKHLRFKDLEERNRKPEYIDVKVVPSSSEDHAYLVAKVRALTERFEDADIVSDDTTVYLCSCDGYYFNQSGGLETDRDVEDIGKCKHCRAAYKHLNAIDDEKQSELTA